MDAAHRRREAGGVRPGAAGVARCRAGAARPDRATLGRAGLSCGAVGKTAVADVNDRVSEKVRAVVVPRTDTATLTGSLAEHAAPDAMVYTLEIWQGRHAIWTVSSMPCFPTHFGHLLRRSQS